MLWIELSCIVNTADIDATVIILSRFGKGGVVIEERESAATTEKTLTAKIYLLNSRHYKDVRKEIDSALECLSPKINLQQRILKPEDWFNSVKLHFGILEIGEKFIIKPSWICRTIPHSNKMIIELDPGAAFGTGLHPSTRLCMIQLEKYLLPGMCVLDLGTGSGILAIAAAKLGARLIIALDIDPLAVRSALSNIKNNRVESNIQVKRGTLSPKRQRDYREAFHLALVNISVKATGEFASALMKVLKNGGILIASGISTTGIDESLINLAMAGFNIKNVDIDGEWCSIIARKPE